MKNEKLRRAIGGIDDDLIAGAEKESSAKAVRRPVAVRRFVLIAAAVVLTVCGLLMFNASVRAAVVGFFLRWEDEANVRVHFDAPETDEDPVDIHDVAFGYLPEGFVAHEIPEDPESEGWDPRIRSVRIIPEEINDLPEIEIANSAVPSLMVWINRAGEIDWGYGNGTYDLVEISEINGMTAFMIDVNKDEEEGGHIMFSDDKITVNISGIGISFDEIIKIAENMTW